MTILSGPQDNVKYTLLNDDGTEAVFNDPTDDAYVGFARWTGLDSPEVRESAYDLVQADGGAHGTFYHGRRPIVGNIEIVPSSIADRSTKFTRLEQAANCLKADATLTWTPSSGVEQFVRVRRNMPLRREDSPGWLSTWQLPLVSADPRIYGTTLNSSNVAPSGSAAAGRTYTKTYDIDYDASPPASATMSVTNEGTVESPLTLRIDGPCTNPQLRNVTVGRTIALVCTLLTGEYITIDTGARTILLNGTTNVYSFLDFTNSQWWTLLQGLNQLEFYAPTYTAPPALFTVSWRHAWI
jgi:hypothetical protein